MKARSPLSWLVLRGYIFAFELKGSAASDIDRLAQGMSDTAKEPGAHLHGILVLDKAFLTTIPVDVRTADPQDYYHVSYATQHPFTAFKLHLPKALATFQRPPTRWVPAPESYFELPKQWKRVQPTFSRSTIDGDEAFTGRSRRCPTTLAG